MNSALTRLLKDWLPQLGPLLARTVISTPDAERGQVDGFDGIGTRGSPERLLSSEWALADAAPDLFLLRAAAGEQLHNQLARRQEANHQNVLLIVDTSPSQAGAAQLVPLSVALVLLHAGNCSVWWTDTRTPGQHHRLLLDDVDSLLAMLATRTSNTVDPLIWQACVDTADGKTTLCIGQPPPGVGDEQVRVGERLTEPVLDVRIGQERVRLPLPAPQQAAQALRGKRVLSSTSGIDGRSLNIVLAGSQRLRIYLWNKTLVRKIEPGVSNVILTTASSNGRIVGVAERGGREWVLQHNGTGYSCGNPRLPSFVIDARWRKAIPRHVDVQVQGVWRLKDRFVVIIDRKVYLLGGAPKATYVGEVRSGDALLVPTNRLLASVTSLDHNQYLQIHDQAGNGQFVRARPGAPPLQFVQEWDGGIRAITRMGHYRLGDNTSSRLPTGTSRAGLLAFWNRGSDGIVPVVLKRKAGTLHVGTQLITAPKLINAVAHWSKRLVVGITEANALVRIDFWTTPDTVANTVEHRLTVVVGRL